MTAVRHHEPVMGTVVSYLVEDDRLPERSLLQAVGASSSELHRLDEIFSTWKPDSPMSRYRRGELDLDHLPEEIPLVLDLCATVKKISRGWFDPWAMPGGVDPTGLVKGWAIERAAGLLVEAGITSGMVNGGGDIATLDGGVPGAVGGALGGAVGGALGGAVGGALGGAAGGDLGGAVGGDLGIARQGGLTETWRIGIRHPWRPDGLACVVEVPHGTAIATSGRYERGEHLVNPFFAASMPRGRPAAVSATVVGPSLSVADGLATALMVADDDLEEVIGGAGPRYGAYRIFEGGIEEATGDITFASAVSESLGGDVDPEAACGSS